MNWVQTNRDVLEPFDGSRQVSLPVYHADSLFALAPVFADSVDPHDTNVNYRLRLYDIEVDLPRFLIRPERQAIFDELLEGAYALSRALSKDNDDVPAQDLVARIIADADSNTNDPASRPRDCGNKTFPNSAR